MRGSASSFGITTSIEVKTFPTPSYAIIFQYNWQLNYTLAAHALGAFQDFVRTDIPSQFGSEIVLTRGGERGNVSFGLTGAWYGAKEAVNSTVQPFLRAMPPPHSVTFSGNGTWIDSVSILAGSPLDTTVAPDTTDTFYAKSLMTPEAEPLTERGRVALMKYLALGGWDTITVSVRH